MAINDAFTVQYQRRSEAEYGTIVKKLGMKSKEMNGMRMNCHVTPIVKLTKSFYRNEEPRLRSLCFSLSPAKLEVHRKKEWCSTHFFQKFLH